MDSDQDRGGNCQVRNSAVDGYGPDTDISYLCDTAGGSSGSPVISRVSNRVVALHHFGGCPNAGVRIDLIYRRVASLLRSEEHTSELQSQSNLVCRLLLEKKK